LLTEFSREEVVVALQQMSALKAPGPDGMTAGFYQENWEVVGSEVCNAVLNSLNIGFINEDLNFTYIALIHMIRSNRKK
jgi:hypothetical protein